MSLLAVGAWRITELLDKDQPPNGWAAPTSYVFHPRAAEADGQDGARAVPV